MGENKDMTNEELKTENSAAASLLNMIVRTENDHDFKIDDNEKQFCYLNGLINGLKLMRFAAGRKK